MSGMNAISLRMGMVSPSLEGGGQGVGEARTTGNQARASERLTHPLAPSLSGRGERSPAFRDELRESAEKLVASALLMPVLEQMTSSPLRPEDGPFAESVAEKRFGPLLHQHFADRMMQSRSFGLVDAVVDRLSREGKTAPAPLPKLEVFA